MQTVELLSLPKLIFAHMYRADFYANRILASQKHIEVSYISEGSLTLEIEKRHLTAEKGDVICLLRDTDIRTCAYHSHRTACFEVNWTCTEDSGLLLPPVTRASEGTDELRQYLDDIIYNTPLYEHSNTRCAEKALAILCEIDARNRRAAENRLPGGLLYTERAKKYIHRQIYQPITQQEVAAYLGITPEYLCSVFKKTEGITLMKYVNRAKLEGIRDLMDREHIPLYKAAALFGFEDANYVSRLYKRLFGYNVSERSQKGRNV